MALQIHMRTGVEKELVEILSAWRSLYPAKYRFFKHALAELRKVQKRSDGSFFDQKGREMRVAFRVPTELWLFIQHRIPGFGRDYEDVKTLLRIAKDFDTRQNFKTTRIFTTGKQEREQSDGSDSSADNA